jgi:hypothetical protein
MASCLRRSSSARRKARGLIAADHSCTRPLLSRLDGGVQACLHLLRSRDCQQLGAADKPAAERIADLGIQIWPGRRVGGTVYQRPERRRHPIAFMLFSIFWWDDATMKQHFQRLLPPEAGRHGEVDPRRVGIAEIVERESSLISR